MTKQLKADIMLVIVTLCWGISYYLMNLSLEEMGPFTLNAYRFLVAFIVAFVVAFPKLKTVNRTTLKYSFFVGTALVFVYIGATFGVMYTSISNSGFLCAMTVAFTPILLFITKRILPDKKVMLVLLMCVIGIALLTLNEQLKPALGDILCLICAFAYAIDLIVTEAAVSHPDVNAFQLGVFQLLFTGVYTLILAFIFEEPAFPSTPVVWASASFLAIFCTGLAFIIQAVAQQYTTATRVGIIFTLEPVFSGIVAFVFAGEILMPRAYLGAVLMIASLVIMEVDFGAVKRKRMNKKQIEDADGVDDDMDSDGVDDVALDTDAKDDATLDVDMNPETHVDADAETYDETLNIDKKDKKR